MSDVFVLNVNLYANPIGTITRLPGDKTIFAFNDAYIADESRPTLGLGFKDATGDIMTDFKPYQNRAMPFFSNLLPEGRLRAYLAQRAGVRPQREFFLLWILGADLPGAVTITPADDEAWPPNRDYELDREAEEDRKNAAFRFSLAGVQLKFSAVGNTTGGLTIPTRGVGGSWIIKFPSDKYTGVPENEYAMMTLARQLGMDVPALELIDLASISNIPADLSRVKGKALAIQRFDRTSDGSAVHIEDFAQVFGLYPADKYGKASLMNIASVIAAEGDASDVRELIRRITFNTLIGNADMHLKNWSLIYPDRRNAHLAPAYDLASTIPYIPDEEAALKVSRSKRFEAFNDDELAKLADRASLPKAIVLDEAHKTVELFHEYWDRAKKDLPISGEVATAIEKHLKKIPIVASSSRT
ncbi:MAG: type II toxin-antitoxin system HipA family toxin [bacterium]